MERTRLEQLVKRAYNKGREYFKTSDGDVEEIMYSLKYNNYFNEDTINDDVEKTVRQKLEKLFRRNGYEPYF